MFRPSLEGPKRERGVRQEVLLGATTSEDSQLEDSRAPGGLPKSCCISSPAAVGLLAISQVLLFHCGRKYALGDLGEMRCIIHFLECFLTLLPSGHPETCLLNVNGAFY